MEKNSLVDRLRLLMGDLSQKEFADSLDESPKNVNNYLTEYSRPSWAFLERLVKIGVNLNWFFTGEGDIYVNRKPTAETSPEIQKLLHELDNDAQIARIVTELVHGMTKAKYDITQKTKKRH